MPDVTLITCTGDRPFSFRLLENYMRNQTYRDWHWIVVDDGVVPTECTMGQQHIRLPPAPNPAESFRKNLIVGMDCLATRKVLFIEDDDLYHPFYVEAQCAWLDHWELTGECRAKYYNVPHRMFKIHRNLGHASLCQTGMRSGPVTAAFTMMLRTTKTPQRADGNIWRRCGVQDAQKFLVPVSTYVISTKGLPGRKGLGIHHKLEELIPEGYHRDPDGEVLRRWAGQYSAPLEALGVSQEAGSDSATPEGS